MQEINIELMYQYFPALQTQKVADGLVCAATFFGVAVAMAVFSGEWREFRNLIKFLVPDDDISSEIIDVYNLNVLIPSVGATSVSSCSYNNFISAQGSLFSPSPSLPPPPPPPLSLSRPLDSL